KLKKMNDQFAANNNESTNKYHALFENNSLYASGTYSIFIIEILTPLGPMLAGATSEGICLLEFINRIKLEKEFIELQKLLSAALLPGRNKHLDQLEDELGKYFKGELKTFSVPLHIPGNE